MVQGTTSDNEWQWVPINDNECYNEWKRMRASKAEWFLNFKVKQKASLVPR